MRIAIAVERLDPSAGGVERTAWQLVGELARRQLDLTLICRDVRTSPPAGVALERIRVPRFWQPLRVTAFSRGMARRTRSGFDVVHSLTRTRFQDLFRAGGGSHAQYMERMYRPGDWRQKLSPRHRAILRIEEAVFRDPRQRIQCNSRMAAREIQSRYDLAPERLITLYNGVDTDRFHPANRDRHGRRLRESLRIEGPLALFAGHGFDRKGLDRAILGLANAHTPSALLVAGRGDSEPFRRLAQSAGVANQVRFLGPRADVENLLAAADLFVLPTRYDPFSNACLEALAAGVPVATTAQNGASELIEPGLNGWIGEDDFAPAFALLDKPDRLTSMARAARQTAESFSWPRHVDALLPLYERIARERATRRSAAQ